MSIDENLYLRKDLEPQSFQGLLAEPKWSGTYSLPPGPFDVSIYLEARQRAYGAKSAIMLVEFISPDGESIPGPRPLYRGKLGDFVYLDVDKSGQYSFALEAPPRCVGIRFGFAAWKSLPKDILVRNEIQLRRTSLADPKKISSDPSGAQPFDPAVITGRAAAQVDSVDVSGALLEAIYGAHGFEGDGRSRMHTRVAGVLSDPLRSQLADSFTVDPLMPSTLRAWITARKPDVVIIDQAALRSGPWAGAESTQGAALYRDILWLLKWADRSQTLIYFLQTHRSPDVRTREIEKLVSWTFPSEVFDAGEADLEGTELTRKLQKYAAAARTMEEIN
ncbi:hypothetical protein E2F48_00930 [Arthrobacter crusticola]|uniref:Uncharacterized protein n=1 Tax=Arthrobacter crusticola TaxID=2547960 RepID=A0A4R5U261_9MICC|nr:hypothetical protein [Arthrobacter crusticola]TDK27730.1 hypothetical protein E2F48_00930 [Arthrobacter crusticola]